MTSEVTYTSYYAKLYFTIVQKAMHLNNDGLFLGQRTLKVWFDILSSLQMCIMSLVRTTQFMNHGIKIVLWWCPHKRLPKWFGNWCIGCHLTIVRKWSPQKNIVVGRKTTPLIAISKDTSLYLQWFWNNLGIMTNENLEFFQILV